MTKTAFLFPGQGAQFVGMGREFYDAYPAAKKIFDQAAEVLGPEMLSVIFDGPESKLQLTEYTQPAILTVSTAIYAVLKEGGFSPSGLAGLSLGEYSALVAAGSLSFENALPLVQKRGLYMQKAVPEGAGKMVAVMGISDIEVENICRSIKGEGVVSPANYNCPGQTVISGATGAVEKAAEALRAAGAKRITPLKVSAPFHCEMLKTVEAEMSREFDALVINEPQVPVVFNVSAKPARDPEQIKKYLVRQVSSPILWHQSVQTLIDLGTETFIGLGPGNSLSRLMKRIAPEIKTFSVEDCASFEKMQSEQLKR